MSAIVPKVSVRLFGFVRVFSLSLCCLPTVMYIRTARFPLSGSLGTLRDRVDNQLSSLFFQHRGPSGHCEDPCNVGACVADSARPIQWYTAYSAAHVESAQVVTAVPEAG
jgi:hypothetical protein